MGPSVVVSLDFELRWGLLDILRDDASAYRKNLEGVREVVPRLLEAFASRHVRATWATVGSLACESWDEWKARAPKWPSYVDPALGWNEAYRTIDPRGRLYFAPDLVDLVANAKGQELASHSFGHVYAREPGFTEEDAGADAEAQSRLFRERWNHVARSYVFPRNQVGFTNVLEAHGIVTWRENPEPFFWTATLGTEQTRLVRALRLADGVMPLGQRRAPARAHRASYFVRLNLPRALWRLHVRRVVGEAKKLQGDESLHLWWHPHNLGADPEGCVRRVGELLDALREAAPSSMRFRSMGEAALAG